MFAVASWNDVIRCDEQSSVPVYWCKAVPGGGRFHTLHVLCRHGILVQIWSLGWPKGPKQRSTLRGFDWTLVLSVLGSMFGKWAKMDTLHCTKLFYHWKMLNMENIWKHLVALLVPRISTKQGQWGNREYYDAATATSPAAAAVSYPAIQCMIGIMKWVRSTSWSTSCFTLSLLLELCYVMPCCANSPMFTIPGRSKVHAYLDRLAGSRPACVVANSVGRGLPPDSFLGPPAVWKPTRGRVSHSCYTDAQWMHTCGL